MMPADSGTPVSSGSRANSFEKVSRNPQEVPLQPLDPEDEDSGSSPFVSLSRGSFDSARHGEGTSEPLLPTSMPPLASPGKAPGRSSSVISAIGAWMKGPSPPYKYRITPWFPRAQAAPGRLVERYFPSRAAKIWLLLGCLGAWGAIFLSFLHASIASQEVPGYGKPVKLSCQARLWYAHVALLPLQYRLDGRY